MSEERIWSLEEQGRRLNAAFKASSGQTRGKSRGRWFVLVPVGVLAALAAFAVFGRPGSVSSLSLDEAVAAVQKAAIEDPGPVTGKITYVKTRSTMSAIGYTRGVGTTVGTQEFLSEVWTSGGRAGWIRATRAPMSFASPRDREVYLDHYTGPHGELRRFTEGALVVCKSASAAYSEAANNPASQLHLDDGTQIPSDPKAVYRLLRSKSRGHYLGPGGAEMAIWYSVTSALRGGGLRLPGPQRAAVAGALGEIPGVRTLGEVNDPNGVPAIGFERRFSNVRARVYFNRTTAMTTYSDEVVVKKTSPNQSPRSLATIPGAPVGTTQQRYELLAYQHVDSVPALKQSRPSQTGASICPELRLKKKRR